MSLFVFITKECEEEARNHGRWNDVLKFREKILQDQRTTLFDKYPPPYLKKRFSRQQRMIAIEKQINDHVVVCFCRFLIRGNSEYDNFKNDPKAYGDQFFEPLVPEDYLNSWLEEQLREDPPPEKVVPTPEENTYLWETLAQDKSHFSDEPFIFESEDWVFAMRQKKIQNQLNRICETVAEIADDFASGFRTVPVNKTEYVVLCCGFARYRKVFLIGLVSNNDEKEIENLKSKYNEIIENDHAEEADILRRSKRSYPALITVSEDIWIDIEKDKESNLALSPEESELLESVHSMDETKQTGFPLFINGRAGSGKSTILQYLFADYVANFLKYSSAAVERPIYLTYSKDLVKRSFEVVSSLISSGYRYALNELEDEKKDLTASIEPSFKEFHKFLLSYLDDNTRNQLFPTKKYIGYPAFKKLWNQKFGYDSRAKKDYGPDISWHIIRTYIKGTSVDGSMDSGEYSELPVDERSVSKETFENVYHRVWETWYKQKSTLDKEEGREFWDDQDLVLYILQNDLIKPVYPAVFCDEAQDFTRIELEAILRMSLFSDRKLNTQDLDRVPFAFAGDPLQTLNPTGFRWEAIKTIFVQKFVQSLDPINRFGKKELNYRELKFNYRSSQNIVKLNNGIQAIRSVLFGYKNLLPQTTWQNEEQPPFPVYFKKEDPIIEEKLREQSEVIIIVPCNEGAEADFVKEDEYLREIVNRDDKGTPQNVFSPSRAKGLEFKRVVLYGFGDHLPDGLGSHLEDYSSVDNTDEKLSHEYFINQLYVAASRPQRRLFIVESINGINNLWSFAKEPERRAALVNIMANRDLEWGDDEDGNGPIGILHEGTSNSWTEDREDLEALAKQYEKEGKYKPDQYMLRQAAMLYEQVKKPRKAKYCKALAAKMEGDFEDAGNKFAEVGFIELAIDSFWAGSHYHSIRELNSRGELRDLADSFEVRFSHFIQSPSINQFQSLIGKVVHRIDKSDSGTVDQELIEDNWGGAIDEGLTKLLLKEEKCSEKEWKTLTDSLSYLISVGVEIRLENVAKCHFNANDIKEAISLWEESGETQSQDYKTAKFNNLLARYKSGDKKSFTNDDWVKLGDLFLKEKNWLTASDMYSNGRYPVGISNLMDIYLNQTSPDDSLVDNLIMKLIDCLSRENEWADILKLVKRGKYELKGKAKQIVQKAIFDDKQKWHNHLVQTIATSQQLPIAPNPVKAGVAKYLRSINRGGVSAKISYPVLGAAIERAGRHIDGLQHYELMEKNKNLGIDEHTFARERWIKVKLKQAEREEKMGMTEAAIQHRGEAIDRAKDLGIDASVLQEYPAINEFLVKEKNKLKESVKASGIDENQRKDKQKEDEGLSRGGEIVEHEGKEKVGQGIPGPESEPTPKVLPKKFRQKIDDITISISRKNKVMLLEGEELVTAKFQIIGDAIQQKQSDVSVEKYSDQFLGIPEWNLRISIERKSPDDEVLSFDFYEKGLSLLAKL